MKKIWHLSGKITIKKPIVTHSKARKIPGIKNEPTMQVIHAMGEYIDYEDGYGAKEWLDRLGLSAHFLITPDGEIIQTLDITQMGYHAKGFNGGSVGIEFMVPGKHNIATLRKAMESEDWVSEEQFWAGVELSAWLASAGIADITRHDYLDPDRKQDPGKMFPWEEFLEEVNNAL